MDLHILLDPVTDFWNSHGMSALYSQCSVGKF